MLIAAVLLRGQSPQRTQQETQQKLSDAAALARSHRFSEAEQALQGAAVPSDPNQAIAYHRVRAAIDAGLQRPQQASLEMHAALRLSPSSITLLRAAAVADLAWLNAQLKTSRRSQLPATLDDLRALPLPGQERADLRSKMGESLLIAREYGDAIVDLSESVWLDPSNAEAWAQLADAQLRDRDPKGALASALQAKALRDTGELEALLGEIYESAGDNVASAQSFESAVRLAPNQERLRLALAIELIQHQTFEPAIAILKSSAIDFPRSARTRTALGLTLFLSGREQEGIDELLEAVSLDSAFAGAVRYLGEIALLARSAPQVQIIEIECRYADAHPSDGESNAICGGLKARLAAQNSASDDWPSILHHLAAAAKASPNSSLAHCEYGKALDERQDWPRARTELEICERLDPNSVEAHYRLARIYSRLGLKELAKSELAQRSAAAQRVAASNEARDQSVKAFLFTMTQ